jgi:DNA-binding response OmpR family regulator
MPIIFLSARGLELNAARLIVELGIRNLLFKPFSPRELIDAAVRCVAPASAGADETPAARSRAPALV